MVACNTLPQGSGFISSVMGYVDCQAQVLGSGAWSALAAPGSSLTVVLTGFLTILIALIGYNLLLGSAITVREATLTFVKIGAVFALATSWPAYRTLVYDVVTEGPAQLASEIGPLSGVVGSDGTLLQRLDMSDRALSQLAILGAGMPAAGTGIQAPPPPFGGFDAFALGGSRILFLLTALAAVGAVRIVTGLMLAFGPFFIAFLMFDSTRSLFEGWVRVLAGTALAAIGVAISLGLELALLEPWLSGVLARRMAGEALPTAPTELFVLVSLFSMLVFASFYACARTAWAFRLPMPIRIGSVDATPARSAMAGHGARASSETSATEAERSRAAAVASVLLATNRREAMAGNDTRLPFDAVRQSPAVRNLDHAATRPVGRTFTRRAMSRVSARALKRDVGA